MRRMLDLFCGEGLAAWGYWRSGSFSEIDGVDTDDKVRTRYSFNFENRDAMTMTYEDFAGYSFIHASPPCQAYSKITPEKYRHNHVRLIAATHHMCVASGLPYVIENVEGAGKELKPNLVMDGSYFGLPSVRRRYFYVSTLKTPIRLLGKKRSQSSPQGDSLNKSELIAAMGLSMVSEKRLPSLTKHGIEQGIPPIFTFTIARMMFDELRIG